MDFVGCAALGLIDLDTTIASLVVLPHAVGHAVDLGQGFAEQLVPVAVEGNDDWVTYLSCLICLVCYVSSLIGGAVC